MIATTQPIATLIPTKTAAPPPTRRHPLHLPPAVHLISIVLPQRPASLRMTPRRHPPIRHPRARSSRRIVHHLLRLFIIQSPPRPRIHQARLRDMRHPHTALTVSDIASASTKIAITSITIVLSHRDRPLPRHPHTLPLLHLNTIIVIAVNLLLSRVTVIVIAIVRVSSLLRSLRPPPPVVVRVVMTAVPIRCRATVLVSASESDPASRTRVGIERTRVTAREHARTRTRRV